MDQILLVDYVVQSGFQMTNGWIKIQNGWILFFSCADIHRSQMYHTVCIHCVYGINHCKIFLLFVVFTCTNASRRLCSYTFDKKSTKKYSHNLWLSVLNFRKSSLSKNWRTYAPVNNDHKSFLFFWRFYMDKGRSDINLILLCSYLCPIQYWQYWSIH